MNDTELKNLIEALGRGGFSGANEAGAARSLANATKAAIIYNEQGIVGLAAYLHNFCGVGIAQDIGAVLGPERHGEMLEHLSRLDYDRKQK